ncbi:50S ribosomal protein L6 [bacterium]|nr:50S ribosomal protein L6 [bacterium]
MSRKGNKSISFSDKVEVTRSGDTVLVKGPKGELTTVVSKDFEIKIEDNSIQVINLSKDRNVRSYHGLYQSLIANMVEGVSNGYKIELELFGVGYRVAKQGAGLNFSLGYSHPVTIDSVEGITFDLEGQTNLSISGIDKRLVGEIAANIIKLRDARKDPYKGKGIKYKGAVLRKKAGKKVK